MAKQKSQREPTIALINIVFLMLIFFMVAGTLAQPLDPALKLVNTSNLEGIAPPNALVVHADGRLSYRGVEATDAKAHIAELSEEERAVVRLVPDRNLSAQNLVRLTRDLRAAGAEKVMLVTEQALE